MASADSASYTAGAAGHGESIDCIRAPSTLRIAGAAHDAGPLHPAGGRRSERGFLAVCAVVFVASTALTIAWCAPMSAMRTMSMPGGWTMSMTWMRMPGQTWPDAAARFLGMWLVMMSAMMLPSFVPMLRRYRRVVEDIDAARLARLTVIASLAYFLVWTVFGIAVYPLGAALAAIEMQAPALARGAPFAIAAIVVAAGAFQFAPSKMHHLALCRGEHAYRSAPRADSAGAWRHGLALGRHCVCSNVGMTAVLLAVGIMDPRMTTVAAAAITAERLAPAGRRVARATGAVLTVAGLFLIMQAAASAG